MKEEKLEQLKTVFTQILDKYFGNNYFSFTVDDVTKELLLEVKIRINDKEE